MRLRRGILFVTREIGRPLGSIMAGFKGKCSQVALALTRGAPDSQGLTPRAPGRCGLTAGAPNPQGRPPARITRAERLALNAVVAEICGGDAGDIAYQGFTPTEEEST